MLWIWGVVNVLNISFWLCSVFSSLDYTDVWILLSINVECFFDYPLTLSNKRIKLHNNFYIMIRNINFYNLVLGNWLLKLPFFFFRFPHQWKHRSIGWPWPPIQPRCPWRSSALSTTFSMPSLLKSRKVSVRSWSTWLHWTAIVII